jgi:hypothetical protein
MVTGWIRTGSELSENHDTRHPNHLIPDLKFHRSAPLASRSLVRPSRAVPSPGMPRPARNASAPSAVGDGAFRDIVATSPRDFAVCGTK